MKTSNIIIIAFVVFMLGSTITLFVDAKNHKSAEKRNNINHSYPLPDFSVVVASDSADMHIEQANRCEVMVELIKDKQVPAHLYEVRNDTLFIKGGLRTFVKCEKIHSLIIDRAFWVGGHDLSRDSLSVNMRGGHLELYNFNVKSPVALRMYLTDSATLEVSQMNLRCFDLTADYSKINLNGKLHLVKATLSHKARLELNHAPEQIVMMRDTTSYINIY